MIISFKIRTLDSLNEEFEVDDQMTVQDLKEMIELRMGIDCPLQRLIFAGKVLKDESRLSQLNLNGMVVHLVSRPPPSVEDCRIEPDLMESQIPAAPRPSQLRSVPFNVRDTVARMSNLLRFIRELDTSMTELRDHVYGNHPGNIYTFLASLNRRDSDSESDDESVVITGVSEGVVNPDAEANNNSMASMTSDGEDVAFSTAMENSEHEPSQYQMSIDLSILMDKLSSLQCEFARYVNLHSNILRNFTVDLHFNDVHRQHSQLTINLVGRMMHTFAHAFHTAADILVLVRPTGTQLTSLYSFPMRQPLQTQINVSQMPSRQREDQSTPNFSTAQNSNATATASPQPGPSRAPDQITYQVEIETRVPIAFAVDNGLVGSLSQNEGQNLHRVSQGNIQQGLESLLREMTQNGVQAEVFSLQNAASLIENNAGGVGPNIVNLSGHQDDSNQSPQDPVQATGATTNQGEGPATTNMQAVQTPVSRMRSTATHTPIQIQATQPPTVPRMRSTVIRGMLLPENAPINQFVQQEIFDSYLPCESCFVRNTVHWRRALDELFTQLRMRNRETAQNFQTMHHLAENFEPNTISVIQNVLNQEPATTGSYFVAVMTCLARQFYTPEVVEPLGDLPGMIPSEFPRIHALLREGLSHINIEEPASRGQAETFINHILCSYGDLLNILNSEELIDRRYDFTNCLIALLRERMPDIIASILNRNENETQVRRFYILFEQLTFYLFVLVIRVSRGYALPTMRLMFETVVNTLIERHVSLEIRDEIKKFCFEIHEYFRKRFLGEFPQYLLYEVRRYLRPFEGAAPEQNSHVCETPPQSSNLQSNEEEIPMTSPLDGSFNFSLQSEPSMDDVEESLELSPDIGTPSMSAFFRGIRLEFCPETPARTPSNRAAREKSRSVGKTRPLSDKKRKTSETTRNLIQSSPETLLSSPQANSSPTLQGGSGSNYTEQKEGPRISVTPRPNVHNIQHSPDHSTLEAATSAETDQATTPAVASGSNVRRLRRSLFESPPADSKDEYEDRFEAFRRRYFSEPRPSRDPKREEKKRFRRRFLGAPPSLASRLENTVTRPAVGNIGSTPSVASRSGEEITMTRPAIENFDLLPVMPPRSHGENNSPTSASLYADLPVAVASVSDIENSKPEPADSLPAVATKTFVTENMSEPARFVDPPTPMATGSAGDLTMSPRPSSRSIIEEATSEHVISLFSPHCAEILARDIDQDSDQEPSSDAYLFCCPLRWRRAVRQQRPSTNANTLIRDVFQEANSSAGASEDAPLLQRPVVANIAEIIDDLATNSPNYSQLRFRATSKVLNLKKPITQQPTPPEESDSDND